MEIIWHILLTVCTGSVCVDQDIQWFKTKTECDTMIVEYSNIPTDGNWDSITYVCKPINSVSL